MYPSDMVPLPEPEGDWLSPCTAQGSPGPEVFGEGCGQRCTVLLGDLNKTSVCHCFGLFIAFSCSLLQHFILRSLVILPCRVQQKCSLLLVYVFQLRLPNNLWSSQSTFPSDARPDARASFPASCHQPQAELLYSLLLFMQKQTDPSLIWCKKSHYDFVSQATMSHHAAWDQRSKTRQCPSPQCSVPVCSSMVESPCMRDVTLAALRRNRVSMCFLLSNLICSDCAGFSAKCDCEG